MLAVVGEQLANFWAFVSLPTLRELRGKKPGRSHFPVSDSWPVDSLDLERENPTLLWAGKLALDYTAGISGVGRSSSCHEIQKLSSEVTFWNRWNTKSHLVCI